MTHKEAERDIPSFFDDSMDNMELFEFLEHIDHCAQCREELTIQFIVGRGLISLEEGENFDIKGELDRRLAHAHQKLDSIARLDRISWIMRGFVAFEFVTLILLALRLWQF